MSAHRTYLDWNASAPLLPAARSAMLAAFDIAGNASSVHAEGRRARALIEEARLDVARLVGAVPADVVFTSGATEANATVLGNGWDHILSAGIEHESVLAAARATPARLIDLPVTVSGHVDVGAAADAILCGDASRRTLLSLQLANNETGVVQPVADIAALARTYGVAVHTDAVQACGRLPVDVAALGVDFLSLSAHKIGGPHGVGALVIRDGAALSPLLRGGGQERRRRAGTEAIAAIAGFGAAARAALAATAEASTLAARRDHLEHAIRAATPDVVIVGAQGPRLPNTSCIALPGATAETLLIKFDLAGIAVSAGAACSSGKVGASHVLMAMGLPSDVARAAIRVSIGPSTTDADVDRFIAAWKSIVRPAALAA